MTSFKSKKKTIFGNYRTFWSYFWFMILRCRHDPTEHFDCLIDLTGNCCTLSLFTAGVEDELFEPGLDFSLVFTESHGVDVKQAKNDK